ncbi:MAG: methylated-DNA--[protein]-cysteine S-methyltransferase [Bacteroidales bacterium]|jgi:methylated-DNA-[protein]-cysteine S-methyltransferase
MKHCHYSYNTVIGMLCIESDDNFVTRISFNNEANTDSIEYESDIIKKTHTQLEEYFCGKRKIFDVPLVLHGTTFQKKVWNELNEIPYGETCSYKTIAIKIGSPKACRAVGMANNKNPIPIIIPCHRIIGINGKLVGYAGGVELKKKLLKIENTYLFNS